MAASPSAQISTPSTRSPHNVRIYGLTLLASLGSWMFGYNNGVISGVLVLPSFITSFNLPPLNTPAYDNTVANIVSLFQIGGLIGSLAMFGCLKIWGRKVCLAGAGSVYLVGAVLQVCSRLRFTTEKRAETLIRPSRMEVFRWCILVEQ